MGRGKTGDSLCKAGALTLEESKIFPESKGLEEGWVLQHTLEMKRYPGPQPVLFAGLKGLKSC